MNKLTTEKKIGIIVFVVAILGFIAELFPIWNFNHNQTIYIIISLFIKLVSSIRLTFLNAPMFYTHDIVSEANTNILNFILYSTLLVGGIFFLFKRFKEIRLIRFFFSIVLINNIIMPIISIISIPILASQIHNMKVHWLLLSILPNVLWIYVSYWVLSVLQKTRTLEIVSPSTEEESNSNVYIEATFWQRTFHFFIDLIFIMLVFSPFILLIGRSFVEDYNSTFSQRLFLYIMLIIFRLIYYPFWETLFGATPAKFLTETRVLNENGTKLNLKTSLLRTLSRFIPFEPFSFLSSQGGWHDGLTKTQVVAEKRTGMYGGKYFLIILLFLGIWLVCYFGSTWYNDHQRYVHYKIEYNKKIASLEKDLKNLNENCIIKIRDKDSYSNQPLLKVEKVKGDDILVTIIPKLSDDYSEYSYNQETSYMNSKSNLSQKIINKVMLENAYTPEYDEYRKGRTKSADILIDGKNYEIEYIEIIYAPKIKTGGYSSAGENELQISLENKGWPADIVKIENMEGTTKWQATLPLRIYHDGYISLRAENYKYRKRYRIKLIVQDSLKRTENYILEGKNTNYDIYKE